jgi:hypothetical protein
LLVWTTTGDTSLAVSPERIKAAPKIWTGTSLFPASQYPKRAAKIGSVVRITAQEAQHAVKAMASRTATNVQPNTIVTQTRSSEYDILT